MNQSIIDNLAQDKAFLEKILSLQTPEEVQNAFKEKGVELTIEEVEILAQTVKSTAENGGSLSDEILQNISGGAEIDYEKIKNISLTFMSIVVSLSALYFVSTADKVGKKVDNTAQTKLGWFLGWGKK